MHWPKMYAKTQCHTNAPFTAMVTSETTDRLQAGCLVILTCLSSWLTKHFLFVLQRSPMTCLLTVVLQLVWILLNVTLNANFFPSRMLITPSNSRLSHHWFQLYCLHSSARYKLVLYLPSCRVSPPTDNRKVWTTCPKMLRSCSLTRNQTNNLFITRPMPNPLHFNTNDGQRVPVMGKSHFRITNHLTQITNQIKSRCQSKKSGFKKLNLFTNEQKPFNSKSSVKTVYSHYKYLQWHSYRLMIMIRVYSVTWSVIIRSYSMSQVTKICDLVKSQIKSQKFKSNPNQIKVFQIKSFFTQIKQPHVIQSWLKSNHDWFCPSLESTILQILPIHVTTPGQAWSNKRSSK